MPILFSRPLRVIVFGLVGFSRRKRGDVPISKKNVAAPPAEVIVVGSGSAVRNAMARGQFVAAAGEAAVVDDGNAAVVVAVFVYNDHFLRRQFDAGGFEGSDERWSSGAIEDGAGSVLFAETFVAADHRVGINVGAFLSLEAVIPFFVGFATEEVSGKVADIGSDGRVFGVVDFFEGEVVGGVTAFDVPENPIFGLWREGAARGHSGKSVFVIVQIHGKGDAQLFEVAHAVHFVRLGLGFGQSGEEHSRQNRNDRDDN